MDTPKGPAVDKKPPLESYEEKRGVVTFRLLVAVFASLMGSVGMGTTLGYTSPSIPLMKTYDKPVRITDTQSYWFGSLMNIGALFGGPVSGLMIEKFGRRSTLIFLSAPFMIGYLLIGYANHVWILFLGRFITGICTGAFGAAIPVYVSELSPPEIRGQLTSGIQLSLTLGLVYVYSLGYSLYWTWLAVACTAFPVIMALILMVMPETPFWLMKYNREAEAMTALLYVRSSNADTKSEFYQVKDDVDKQNSAGAFRLSMLKQPSVYKPFAICLCVMFFVQFSGSTAVMFYTVSIFKAAGSSVNPNLGTIFTGITHFLGTVSTGLLIEKAGRRALLIISGAGMCVSLVTFGIYYYLENVKKSQFEAEFGWVPLVCLIAYNFSFAVGYGPISFILLGELFPLRAKGFCSGFATGFNWFCAFLVTKEFPDMVQTFGEAGTYSFFAAICFLSCVFVFVFVPETKGRSFEEIEQLFQPTTESKVVEVTRL